MEGLTMVWGAHLETGEDDPGEGMAEIIPGMGFPHLDLGEDDPGEGMAALTPG